MLTPSGLLVIEGPPDAAVVGRGLRPYVVGLPPAVVAALVLRTGKTPERALGEILEAALVEPAAAPTGRRRRVRRG